MSAPTWFLVQMQRPLPPSFVYAVTLSAALDSASQLQAAVLANGWQLLNFSIVADQIHATIRCPLSITQLRSALRAKLGTRRYLSVTESSS